MVMYVHEFDPGSMFESFPHSKGGRRTATILSITYCYKSYGANVFRDVTPNVTYITGIFEHMVGPIWYDRRENTL